MLKMILDPMGGILYVLSPPPLPLKEKDKDKDKEKWMLIPD